MTTLIGTADGVLVELVDDEVAETHREMTTAHGLPGATHIGQVGRSDAFQDQLLDLQKRIAENRELEQRRAQERVQELEVPNFVGEQNGSFVGRLLRRLFS